MYYYYYDHYYKSSMVDDDMMAISMNHYSPKHCIYISKFSINCTFLFRNKRFKLRKPQDGALSLEEILN